MRVRGVRRLVIVTLLGWATPDAAINERAIRETSTLRRVARLTYVESTEQNRNPMKCGGLNLWVLLIATLSVASCGGGGGATLPDPGLSSGLDTTTTIYGLSADDDTTLCDWEAGRLGGYGRSRQCGVITVSSPPSEAECVSVFQSFSAACPITVLDFQNCVNTAVDGPCPSGSIPGACNNLTYDGLTGTCQ